MRQKSLTLLLILLVWVPLLAACQSPAAPDVKDPNWWNDATFYEIFVRSFADSNGDGIGDFKGLTSKLDYLNDGKAETHTDLGIDAIWLMPFLASPSYHGYDVSDYMSVNPAYGTLDDFKQFLDEAHKRGIHVIMDFVINHTSTEHAWFKAALNGDPKYRDYYIWSKTDPNYSGPWGEKVWYQKDGSDYYYAVFDPGMPDLNYRNPAVTDEIHKVASYWIEAGIDGFRIDGAKHLIEVGETQANTPETQAWLKDFRSFYQGLTLKYWQPAQKPMAVGEIWDASSIAAPYVNNGDLDLVFNFELADQIMGAAKLRDGSSVAHAESAQSVLFTQGRYATFLTNHDMDRVMSRFQGDFSKAKAAGAILLTAPGVPFIYYGEEIGMTGPKPDQNIRAPMQWSAGKNGGFTSGDPWTNLYPDFDQVNIEKESADPQSLLSLYRDLIQLRSQHYALRVGQYIQLSSSDSSVYAALRVANKEALLVLVNMNKDAVKGPKLSWDASPLKGSYRLSALLGGGSYSGLKVGEKGEGASYQPVSEIPGNGVLIARLTQ
jgi:alpha-amylase